MCLDLAYQRSDFPHWSAGQVWGDGLDAREEVLVARAHLGQVHVERGRILSGVWIDAHTGARLTDPAQIHADHLIPLAFAWRRGASAWPRAKRKRFANDPSNIILTSAKANTSRGALGPDRWVLSAAGAWIFLVLVEEHGLVLRPVEARPLDRQAAGVETCLRSPYEAKCR